MKEIKTAKYIQKEAQNFSDNLPPGVDEPMIDKQFGGQEKNDVYGQTGETEVEVDWRKLTEWAIAWDPSFPKGIAAKPPSTVLIKYTYDYDRNAGDISNIAALSVIDLTNQVLIKGPLMGTIINYHEREIEQDIKISESL